MGLSCVFGRGQRFARPSFAAPNRSLNHHLGILTLERQICAIEDAPAPAQTAGNKRAKVEHKAPVVNEELSLPQRPAEISLLPW